MEDKMLQQKYRYLYNELSIIKEKLKNLIDIYDDLSVDLKDTIMVDDEVVARERFKELLSIKNEVFLSTRETIKQINNKM